MIGKSVDVLDHGYVRLRGVMGDDLEVVNDARVSFDKKSEWKDVTWDEPEEQPRLLRDSPTMHFGDYWEGQILKPGDERLLNFCAREGHWSPFAHSQLKFEIKMPMLVKNQWIKHRIGMAYLTDEDAEAWDNEGWNEQSFRYVEPSDFYIPSADDWRSAPENKKQGSGDNLDWSIGESNTSYLDLIIEESASQYHQALKSGVAPEQARLFLPMYAMYTKVIWTTSLFGAIRFIELRDKPDAQWEIRQYANVINEFVEEHFPYSHAAFGLGAGKGAVVQ